MFECTLDQRPRVRAVAVASHGPRTVERFTVGDLWCLHFYRYHGKIKIGPDTFVIVPGSVGITPPGAPAEYVFSERSTHGYVHFEAVGKRATSLAPILAMGGDFALAWSCFDQALTTFPLHPLHAEVKIWDLLLGHAERTALQPQAENPTHPAVLATLRTMELRLAEPLTVAELATHVGLSHNHLTRLFRQHLGKTVVGYLIERRMERAGHLLRHSTMPVKQVAAQVGVNDLHAFNKAVRNRFGCSSREVRGGLSRETT